MYVLIIVIPNSGKNFVSLHPVMMYTSQELLFSMVLAAYMAVCFVVAVVRWSHKCEPYAKHMDYYYPAWKSVIICFLSNNILIPTLINPTDPDSLLLLRVMLILGSPFYCAALTFTYFGKVLKVHWWRTPIYVLSVPFWLMLLFMFTMAVIPGVQVHGGLAKWLSIVSGIMGLVFLSAFLTALWMIVKAIRKFSAANYSNPEDFPYRYAARIIWIPIFHIGFCWVCTIIGTLTALTVVLSVLSVLSIILLVGILSPHRAMDVERLETGDAPTHTEITPADETDADASQEVLSPERKEEILRSIRRYVEEDMAYLDSHLTLASLSRSCGVNRSYVSQVINEQLGGFFSYVNSCRMAYAEAFRKQNPNASIEEMAMASGFGSRQSYYNVRRHSKACDA